MKSEVYEPLRTTAVWLTCNGSWEKPGVGFSGRFHPSCYSVSTSSKALSGFARCEAYTPTGTLFQENEGRFTNTTLGMTVNIYLEREKRSWQIRGALENQVPLFWDLFQWFPRNADIEMFLILPLLLSPPGMPYSSATQLSQGPGKGAGNLQLTLYYYHGISLPAPNYILLQLCLLHNNIVRVFMES